MIINLIILILIFPFCISLIIIIIWILGFSYYSALGSFWCRPPFFLKPEEIFGRMNKYFVIFFSLKSNCIYNNVFLTPTVVVFGITPNYCNKKSSLIQLQHKPWVSVLFWSDVCCVLTLIIFEEKLIQYCESILFSLVLFVLSIIEWKFFSFRGLLLLKYLTEQEWVLEISHIFIIT